MAKGGWFCRPVPPRMLEEYCDQIQERTAPGNGERSSVICDRGSVRDTEIFRIEYQKDRSFGCWTAAKTIGLTLTDSCMMVPSKSVTAVIGDQRNSSARVTDRDARFVQRQIVYTEGIRHDKRTVGERTVIF